MPDAFTVLAENLDHPEGIAWGPDGRLYAGGEAGQVYAISLHGEVEQVADTGGCLLGITLDADGIVYACDDGRSEVVRVDPKTAEVTVYSSGAPEDRMVTPNYATFDDRGTLYVTSSGDTKKDNGLVFRVAPGGATTVWSRAVPRYPNGCCLSLDGNALYVVESYLPGVSRIPIRSDGSAGAPEVFAHLPHTVPDGIALDNAGNLYVACYRPDRIYRVSPQGTAEILADDPEGILLNAPTNIAFAGDDLSLMAVANVGEVHVLIADLGIRGAPLRYPGLASM